MKKNLILYLSIVLFITGCDFNDGRLIINNTSSENVYIDYSNDTVLDLGKNRTFAISGNYVAAHSSEHIIKFGAHQAWEMYAMECKGEKLHIFFLSEDTLDVYKPLEIVAKQRYQKRVDISIKELEQNNWEVKYP